MNWTAENTAANVTVGLEE